jgi:hypothetical protein
MATASIAGYAGSVTGPQGMAEVVEWRADIRVAQLDVTSMASGGFEEYIAGLTGGDVSISCLGKTVPTRGSVASLALIAGSGGPTISGRAIIGQVSVAVPVADKLAFDVSAKFSGTITIA